MILHFSLQTLVYIKYYFLHLTRKKNIFLFFLKISETLFSGMFVILYFEGLFKDYECLFSTLETGQTLNKITSVLTLKIDENILKYYNFLSCKILISPGIISLIRNYYKNLILYDVHIHIPTNIW